MKKVIVFIGIICFMNILFGQVTTLFFSDFEDDDHGWTIVNGTAINRWFVGSAATHGSGNAIYVSRNSGVNHIYDENRYSIVHFYRDVFIPANTHHFVLNFDLVCQGQGAFDYLRVSLIDPSITPVAIGTNVNPNIHVATNENSMFYHNHIGLSHYSGLGWGWNNINIIEEDIAVGVTKRLVFRN